MALVRAKRDRRRGAVAWGHGHALFERQGRDTSDVVARRAYAPWERSTWNPDAGGTDANACQTPARLLCLKWHYGCMNN